MKRVRNIHCVLFLLLGLMFLSQVQARAAQPGFRLDPRVRILLQQLEQKHRLSSTSIAMVTEPGQGPRVGLLLKARKNPVGIVTRLGGRIESSHGDIYSVQMPLSAVIDLGADITIEYIEASCALYPDLITSVPKSGARALHELPGTAALTGKGVIVGITDTGIDWKHDDFKNADGSSRILYIWDQYLTGRHPQGFNYGAEFTSDQINAGNIAHRDADGHGTHVASIAAGNGRSTNRYIGMAPEADIIMVRGSIISPVKGGASSGGFLDGYAYIRARAEALGKRHVVNSSFGTTLGPHDGTTLYEQAMNYHVSQGTIITNSAGNYADQRWHAEAILTPRDSVVLLFSAPDDSLVPDDELQIDIWYESNDRIDVQVASPGLGYHPKIEPYTFQFLDTDDGFISVTNDINSPLNGDNEIFIQIDRSGSAAKIARGTWRIKFTTAAGNSLPDGGEIDAWTERDDNAVFLNYIDVQETINYPSTADSVISVACFDNQSNSLTNFSSRGARRDGFLKPDLAAVGENVTAARSSFTTDPSHGDAFHTRKSGTSMSAPHVCGAIALMLQADSTLTPWQVRQRLYQAARADAFTGQVPNTSWGRGKLDIFSAVLPLIANKIVTGTVADSSNGTGIPAQLTFYMTNSPLPEPIAITTTGSDGQYRVMVAPGEYRVEIVPAIPYPVLKQKLMVLTDSTNFSLALVPARVILINDDPNGNYSHYYTDALDSLGMTYAIHTSAQKGELTEAQQATIGDQQLIWLTGDAVTGILSASEQAFLSAFLDRGGRLFLTGQNLAESLTGTEFLSRRLHVSFLENSTDFMLHGVSAHPVGAGLKTIITMGTAGANNQNSRDVLVADEMAKACVVFDTTRVNIAGVTVATPANGSRLVFFGFGFEAINVGAVPRPGFAGREKVLKNVMSWLSGVTSVLLAENISAAIPLQLELGASFPNPLRATAGSAAVIRYWLPVNPDLARVKLTIYDILGRQVTTLVDRPYQPGTFEVRWDGRDGLGQLGANGVYFYQLEAGAFYQVKKLVLMR